MKKKEKPSNSIRKQTWFSWRTNGIQSFIGWFPFLSFSIGWTVFIPGPKKRKRMVMVRSLAILALACLYLAGVGAQNIGSVDVLIPSKGASGEIQLGATIRYPLSSKGKIPGVLLIAGSGPQDRDEYISTSTFNYFLSKLSYL
jgi:hypothetical protein